MLDKHGISYEGLTARQVTKKDLDEFDYIVAMDQHNVNDLIALGANPDKGAPHA